jgi:2,3-bisphosphoglycerate-dependent phosphoglycerate mutase
VSVLKRAIRTLWIALDAARSDVDSRRERLALNERHYGALQGLNKAETAASTARRRCKIWRRSYDIPPPPLRRTTSAIPRTIRATRVSPPGSAAHRVAQGHGRAVPAVLARHDRAGNHLGQARPRAAHGNSLRALVKYLDNVSESQIVELNIPTGIPWSTNSTPT